MKKKKAPDTATAQEAVELLMTVPEIAEAFTQAEIELAIDDRGWERFGYTGRAAYDDRQTRALMVDKCRLYWMRDPLAKQAVRLWTDYGVGTGVTYQAKVPAVQAQLDRFTRDRRNRKLMSKQGQQRSSKKLLVDGEVFFAIFGAAGEDKIIRYVDPMQITDFVTDPDDDEHVLCYRRQTADNQALFYADWDLDDEGRALLDKLSDPVTKKKITLELDAVVYYLPFDPLMRRGNSLLSTTVDWSREHRRFMAARVAIVQALSKFAWKQTVKGGPQVLQNLKQRMESTLAQTGTQGGPERHPVPAPGSTWAQNLGTDLTPMPRATGAGDAREDSNNLKLMVAAGTNIMLHYFGDPSTGNLATATAMELPMLKSFSAYQELWKDAYRDLFGIVLEEGPDEDPAVIDIDLPPILEDDLQKLGGFIAQAAGVFPEMKVPEVLQMLLISLGMNNVDEVMKVIAAKRKELDAQPVVPPAAPLTPVQQAQMKESYDQLAAAFNRLADKL